MPDRTPRDAETLALDGISWSGPQLHVAWRVDRLRFTTALWYDHVDFDALGRAYGPDVVRNVAFHIALFEVNKGVSFGPRVLELPDAWSPLLTDELYELWRTVVRKVWAQWRYQHGRPGYRGPEVGGRTVPGRPPRLLLPAAEVSNLWFCGGGKDSLLAGHLLGSIGERYDALAYAHSVYGRSAPQFALIDRVVGGSGAGATHRIAVADTASDLPLTVLAAETPASVFAALPLVLGHGYRNLLLGHERSANVGNLVWDATGEDVNHQWGKSLEAENLLGEYLRQFLVPEVTYCSLLQTVHDALIFASLRDVAHLVPDAHSCNVEKPWCMRCAKCAYVWICYKAWLPWEPVDRTFGGANLLDLPENQPWFRQMLGLEAHTPFECIGQVDEARLAFVLARARGLTGRAMGYLDEVSGFEPLDALDRYLAVERHDHRAPTSMAGRTAAFFGPRAAAARSYAEALLLAGGQDFGLSGSPSLKER